MMRILLWLESSLRGVDIPEGGERMKKLAFWCVLFASFLSFAVAGQIDLSKRSSVVIILRQKVDSDAGKRTMDMIIEDSVKKNDVGTGTVFDIKGRVGANYRFRIEDFNTLKYAVKEVSSAAEAEKFKLPPIFATAFKDLLAGSTDLAATAAKAEPRSIESGILNQIKGILNRFYSQASEVDTFMKKVDAISKASKEVETYALFRTKLKKELSSGWDVSDALSDLIKEQKANIAGMRACSFEINYLSDQNESNLLLKSIRYSLEQISKKATEFGDKLDKIEEVFKQYATNGQKQFIYVSETPIEFKGGKLSIALKISDKADEKANAIYQLDFDISSKSRNFLDTSTGVFVCNLHDRSYNLVQEADGNHIVRRGAKDQLRAQFGAMINYGWVICDDFSVAISFGLGLSNSKFQFYFGPSIALSQKRSIYISGGAVLGSVKRLKAYNTGDLFTGQAKDIPTDDYYQLGGFLGLTYKF